MDKVTSDRIALLHPAIRDEVFAAVNVANSALGHNVEMRIAQGLRTFAEQDALYNKVPKVTQAKAGQSYHNYGLAIDFFIYVDGKTVSWDTKKDWNNNHVADWLEVVQIFTKRDYEWGGLWKFKDYPHLQKTFGLTWKEMLKRHNAKDFIPGTNYIRI